MSVKVKFIPTQKRKLDTGYLLFALLHMKMLKEDVQLCEFKMEEIRNLYDCLILEKPMENPPFTVIKSTGQHSENVKRFCCNLSWIDGTVAKMLNATEDDDEARCDQCLKYFHRSCGQVAGITIHLRECKHYTCALLWYDTWYYYDGCASLTLLNVDCLPKNNTAVNAIYFVVP